MIERMFERIPAWAISAAAIVLIAVLIYTAGWWWAGWPAPRWKCVYGYWHWRGCDGHDEFGRLPVRSGGSSSDRADGDDIRTQPGSAAASYRIAGGAPVNYGATATLGHDQDDGALDEAWPEQLHRINQDIRVSVSAASRALATLDSQPVIDWAGMSWRDRGELERWDWGRRMAADGAEWMHRMDVERHAWRDEMGLAA